MEPDEAAKNRIMPRMYREWRQTAWRRMRRKEMRMRTVLCCWRGLVSGLAWTRGKCCWIQVLSTGIYARPILSAPSSRKSGTLKLRSKCKFRVARACFEELHCRLCTLMPPCPPTRRVPCGLLGVAGFDTLLRLALTKILVQLSRTGYVSMVYIRGWHSHGWPELTYISPPTLTPVRDSECEPVNVPGTALAVPKCHAC